MRIACFITPHGFGHAARAAAVLDALGDRVPGLAVDVFGRAPASFLASTLRLPWRRVPCHTDVGMIQEGPFRADLEATADAVEAFLAGLDAAADRAAERLAREACPLALCDISPLGIVAAQRAGIPSVLIENFRWDWIYPRVEGAPARLVEAAGRMGAIFRRADLHLQVPPVCDPVAGAAALELPIARPARAGREEARCALGIAPGERVVLVTTGGIAADLPFLDALRRRDDLVFVVTGMEGGERDGNVVPVANTVPLYLPDALRAADAVVCKIGYSTLTEAWREGRPLLRVPRQQWPEGPVMAAWADRALAGWEMAEETFLDGSWVESLDELLALPCGSGRERAGQDEAAERILALLD